MASVREAALARRSAAKVTDASPDDAALLELLGVAERVADHAALRPWRTIALRGGARERLGAALVAASGFEGDSAAKLAAKPLRAPLVLALVLSPRFHPKAPEWEQLVAAAGVGHLLSLLLDEAGWGVMWRTGPFTRHPAVAEMHGLAPGEQLLGWLYVGGRPDGGRPGRPAERPAPRFSSID
ncbi:nitroreductase family protein [Agromyces italicus]|uniref:nitroreductase family protein n=1 Tax=Agromyces italicus TaxID=279572 RepID=UPI0003B3462B|nr:nitroreductase family protein [Agromyces italicus]